MFPVHMPHFLPYADAALTSCTLCYNALFVNITKDDWREMLTVVTSCCVFISQDAEETLSSSSHEGFVAREHYVTSLPPRPWASLGRHGGGTYTCIFIHTYA